MKNQIHLYSNLQTATHIYTNGSVSMGLHLEYENSGACAFYKNLCTQMAPGSKDYPIHALYFKTFNMKKYKVADMDVYSNKL